MALDLPPGWLHDSEARQLAEMAKGKLVLEIGAWLGRSTVAMAQTARHVVSVDHHRGSPEHQPGASHYDPTTFSEEMASYFGKGVIDTLPGLRANLLRYSVEEKVTVILTSTVAASEFLRPAAFEMAFVDGQHDYNSAQFDGLLALRCVKLGCPVVFHDFVGWPGVQQAVAGFTKNGKAAFKLAGTMVYVNA